MKLEHYQISKIIKFRELSNFKNREISKIMKLENDQISKIIEFRELSNSKNRTISKIMKCREF